ncbi:MAG TPA: hypothetical protein VJR58_24455 [Vineibacter sp.]|nr:hypothetical protein [Vineibacter sp.]
MEGAPFRVTPYPRRKPARRGVEDSFVPPLAQQPKAADSVPKYVEATVKLIPGEVVSAYLAGKAMLQNDPAAPLSCWIGWTLLCCVLVVWLRRWMTSDKSAAVPPDWPAVGIATLSFVVWVYSMGDVFAKVNVWDQHHAWLYVLIWTLAAPGLAYLLSKGSKPGGNA